MRNIIIVLICCTVLLLLGYSGYRGYESWKQNHGMVMARQFAAKGDANNEFLSLEQVLALNPRNLEARRMVADLAEIAGSRSAIDLRKKVLELDPASVEDQLKLAQEAVLVHDYQTATNALAAVDTLGKKNAIYYNILGQVDLAIGKSDEAESDFAESIRIDPSNTAPQLSLAVVQLHRTNGLDMAEARISLRRISMNSTNLAIRAQADRELVLDALRTGDYNTALWYSKDLEQRKNALFFDKLLRLDVLKASKSDEFNAALADREHEASTNSSDTYNLFLWFVKYNRPGQALLWIQTLPANTQTNWPVAMMAAQCQMLLQNWSAVQNSISKQNWGPSDFTRQAYLARAMRQQGLYEASQAQWDVALKSATGDDDKLKTLLRFAVQWNWQEEAQQILLTIVNNFPQEQWASQELSRVYYQSGRTRSLMELFSTQANRNPLDLDAKNDLALTAMLLHAQELRPYDLARDVYQKASTNPRFACTYAFSLYLQGKNSQALKIMQQLPPQSLKDSATAGYYGLILKAAGENSTAMGYLKYALNGKVLPEERALFEQAANGS